MKLDLFTLLAVSSISHIAFRTPGRTSLSSCSALQVDFLVLRSPARSPLFTFEVPSEQFRWPSVPSAGLAVAVRIRFRLASSMVPRLFLGSRFGL